MISLTFCQYSSRYDSLISGKLPNVFNPEFAGGALMDINLYNIHFWLVCLENQTVSNISPEHMKMVLIHMVFLFFSLVILYVNAVVPKIPPVKTMFRSWVKKDISMSVPEAVIVKTADLYSVIQNVLFVRRKLHGITKSKN